MSRQNSSNIEPDHNKHSNSVADFPDGLESVDIQQELNRLEEIILASPHIPLTRRTLVDEEKLLDQLDLVRLRLPEVLREAQAIVNQKQAILLEAEQDAEKVLRAAQAKAAQLLSEMEIVQQAELEAEQLRQQVQQECMTIQEESLIEIDRIRQQAQQELQEMQRNAIAEAEEIQQGADTYADTVLTNLEQQLNDIIRIIHNGRRQLQSTNPPRNSPSPKPGTSN